MKEQCLGFFTNPDREDLVEAVRDVALRARNMGFACSVSEELAALTALPPFSQAAPDVILAFGGDGTILRAAGRAVVYDAPLCGVNMGRVGFLSETVYEEIDALLSSVAQGSYSLQKRMMLQCSLNKDAPRCALNDVLLYKKSYSGVVGIHITVDGMYTGCVYADGVVISTPTGATGYSISAGGPVIAPGADVALITPICPHSLTYRSIVASANAKIDITIETQAKLALDGNHVATISAKDSIHITRAQQKVSFMQLQDRNFYTLIRERLS